MMEAGHKPSTGIRAAKKSMDLELCLQVIAHEIRNPLVSIQGYTTLLQEKFDRHLPEEAQDYLRRICTNLKRVEVLLKDIARLARISIDETGFSTVQVTELIDSALEPHVLELHQKRLELSIEPDLPELYCDANCMVLVFSNLIGNAIKYSKEGPGGKIRIGYLRDEIFHKFYVRDNGVGFPTRDSRKVFQVFRRLHNKRSVAGSGLGLTIVRQIIEGHGGEVWVESRKNQGATFFFTLPRHSPGARV